MSATLWISAAVLFLGAAWCLATLTQSKRDVLPVLLFGKTGKPFPSSKDKNNWVSYKRLEKLFAALKRKGYQTVLPGQIISSRPLPPRPVLLVFSGGYQTFYTDVFPLLQKYGLKAAAGLSAALVGQYDAWTQPQDGPWQNLLNDAQIKELNKSGLAEFISETLDGTSIENADDDTAVWQLAESKRRLRALQGLKINAVHFPQKDPHRPAVLFAARNEYALVIGNTPGNNLLPLGQTPLRVLPVRTRTSITRLFWRMKNI